MGEGRGFQSPYRTSSHVHWCLPHVSLTRLTFSLFHSFLLSNNDLKSWAGYVVCYKFVLQWMTAALAVRRAPF